MASGGTLSVRSTRCPLHRGKAGIDAMVELALAGWVGLPSTAMARGASACGTRTQKQTELAALIARSRTFSPGHTTTWRALAEKRGGEAAGWSPLEGEEVASDAAGASTADSVLRYAWLASSAPYARLHPQNRVCSQPKSGCCSLVYRQKLNASSSVSYRSAPSSDGQRVGQRAD